MAAKAVRKKRRKVIAPERIEAVLPALPAAEVQRIAQALKKPKRARGRAAINLEGKTIGAWMVSCRGPNHNGAVTWICLCECGASGIVAAGNLLRGQSTRCRSCAGREVVKNLKRAHPRARKVSN